MTYEEAIQIIGESFIKIKNTNDKIIDATKRLDIILINLQIENAHISQATGITPIAIALRDIINTMRDDVTGLVVGNRVRLTEALEVVRDYNK